MSPLRRRMIDDMQIRNLTPNTQRVYVAQVARFACYFRKSPELLGPDEIRTYLIHLTRERRLAASSIIVAVAALRFFFTVTLKRPGIVEDDIPAGRQAKKLPVVLSQEEVARFLSAVDNLKHRVILTVCYATGLRISEAVRLKPGAIDSKRMVIRVEQGKGRKDRYVMLPPKLLDILRDYWDRTRPGEWLFPGRGPGQPVDPSTIEHTCRAVRLVCGIGKPVAPHALRHAFGASAGSRHRSAHHPVVARPSQSHHHGAVSDDLHQHGLRHRQSAGVPRHRLANLAGPRPGLKRGLRGPRGAGSGGRVPPLRPGFP
jgi:integrase/recombinase XerD